MFIVTLYRANGRVTKTATRRSRYAAKQLQQVWEDKYDDTYYVKIDRGGRREQDL